MHGDVKGCDKASRKFQLPLWEHMSARRTHRSDLLYKSARRNVPKISIGEMMQSVQSWLTDDFRLSDSVSAAK